MDRSPTVTDDSFSLSLAVFYSSATGTHEKVYFALNIADAWSEALGQTIVENVG